MPLHVTNPEVEDMPRLSEADVVDAMFLARKAMRLDPTTNDVLAAMYTRDDA